jgi:hypothetical protein
MPRRVNTNFQPHETPNITEPVPERKSCSLTRTSPRWRTQLVTPFVLPDNGLRIGLVDTLGSWQRWLCGSWAQHLDIAITTPTTPPLPKTPLTVQNVNSILTIFCSLTVDLGPNRWSCQEARPRHVFLSGKIYVATNQ